MKFRFDSYSRCLFGLLCVTSKSKKVPGGALIQRYLSLQFNHERRKAEAIGSKAKRTVTTVLVEVLHAGPQIQKRRIRRRSRQRLECRLVRMTKTELSLRPVTRHAIRFNCCTKEKPTMTMGFLRGLMMMKELHHNNEAHNNKAANASEGVESPTTLQSCLIGSWQNFGFMCRLMGFVLKPGELTLTPPSCRGNSSPCLFVVICSLKDELSFCLKKNRRLCGRHHICCYYC